MSTPDPNPDVVEGALPAFESPGPEEELPPDPELPPAAETPSQTSSSPRRPQLPPSHDETATRSSTGSSDPAASFSIDDVKDAIGDFGAALFAASAQAINHLERRRTRRPTERWLATEEEARGFGELAEQYLVDKIPDSLTDGDGAALAVGGLHLAGYVARNLLRAGEVDPVRGDAPRAPEAPRERQAPPAAPPAAPVVHVGASDPHSGVAPPEPGPITVIAPDI